MNLRVLAESILGRDRPAKVEAERSANQKGMTVT